MTNKEPLPAYLDDNPWPKRLFFIGVIGGIAVIISLVVYLNALQQERDLNATLYTPQTKERAAQAGFKYIHFDLLRGVKPGEQQIGNSLFRGIPEEVKQFNGERVALEGFVQPIDVFETGAVKRFQLFRHLASCCFGAPPQLNEWVIVDVKGDDAKQVRCRLGDGIAVYGTFKVNDQPPKPNEPVVYYQLEAERIEIIQPF